MTQSRSIGGRLVAWAVLAALVALPAVGRGDVVRLRDGSTIKGRVTAMVRDTVMVRTSFGADLRLARSEVALISFDDTLAVPQAAGHPAQQATPAGPGRIGVTFKDRGGLSSKIGVERGKDEAELLRANWIEVLFLVDDDVVYTAIDSTMDKTIYNGPVRTYKNSIELEDFAVEVTPGFHHAALLVRNVGGEDYAKAFEGDPLDVRLPLDNLQIAPERTLRVIVGIDRGRLRMGKPRFYREE